jgi:molybdate transport system ATP-binding protein
MIEIDIKKVFQSSNNPFLLDITLTIEKGQFITLYGESGAGKTTILRAISGLINPDSGTIITNNIFWFHSDKNICLSPQKRKIGFLFQDYALFPNMTVKENLTFAQGSSDDSQIINELVEMLELRDIIQNKPESLSGGQKQRAALARALVSKPEILLLDEPLSALDNKMRHKLQDYLSLIHKKYELTTIMVSHDVGEIIKLSDYVYEIKKGIINRQAPSSAFFKHSESSAKFQFSGEIIEIVKEDVVYIVLVLIGSNVVKVVADRDEIKGFALGDKVFVASKAFNPIIQKI